jgi:hypothetical protein
MGSAVSSHHSCREHGGRLKRVVGNQARGAQCGVCQDEVRVEVRERVHRCRTLECTFVLHDRCYRLRATVKRRFGGTEHQLVLRNVDDGAGGERSCNLCAERLRAHTHEYMSTVDAAYADRFRVHPSCCNLPPTMSDVDLHQGCTLVLHPPPSTGARSSRCLKCRRISTPSAWLYRCPNKSSLPECIDKVICLRCVLGTGRAGSLRCCGVDPERLGVWIGELLCGIGQGMGLPCRTAAATNR